MILLRYFRSVQRETPKPCGHTLCNHAFFQRNYSANIFTCGKKLPMYMYKDIGFCENLVQWKNTQYLALISFIACTEYFLVWLVQLAFQILSLPYTCIFMIVTTSHCTDKHKECPIHIQTTLFTCMCVCVCVHVWYHYWTGIWMSALHSITINKVTAHAWIFAFHGQLCREGQQQLEWIQCSATNWRHVIYTNHTHILLLVNTQAPYTLLLVYTQAVRKLSAQTDG